LANAHGRTCITTPVGREFVTIPIPAEQFQSGQTVETILVFFAGSEREDIEFTTEVLATPGNGSYLRGSPHRRPVVYSFGE
jgi:hypothetical protein